MTKITLDDKLQEYVFGVAALREERRLRRDSYTKKAGVLNNLLLNILLGYGVVVSLILFYCVAIRKLWRRIFGT